MRYLIISFPLFILFGVAFVAALSGAAIAVGSSHQSITYAASLIAMVAGMSLAAKGARELAGRRAFDHRSPGAWYARAVFGYAIAAALALSAGLVQEQIESMLLGGACGVVFGIATVCLQNGRIERNAAGGAGSHP